MDMNEKYILLIDESIYIDGHILHRIMSKKNFGDVEEDELGGFVESIENLSLTDDSWVYPDSMIYGNARIFGDSKVYNSKIYGDNILIRNSSIISDSDIICIEPKHVSISNSTIISCRILNSSCAFSDSFIKKSDISESLFNVCNKSSLENSNVSGVLNISDESSLENSNVSGVLNISDRSHILNCTIKGGCVSIIGRSRIDTMTIKSYKECQFNVLISDSDLSGVIPYGGYIDITEDNRSIILMKNKFMI